MEQALYKWFMTQRRSSIHISDAVLKSVAKKFHSKFCEKFFFASDGWVTRRNTSS